MEESEIWQVLIRVGCPLQRDRGGPIFTQWGGQVRSLGRNGRFYKDTSMTKLSFGAHPHLLGFEQLERLVERTAKSAGGGYPPFNIEAVSEHEFRITLAVAGFCDEDLSITVENRQLVVRGRQTEEAVERIFLHRGIAARAFQRSFVLAEGVEVAHAGLEHGLLHIALRRTQPDVVVQTIPIDRR